MENATIARLLLEHANHLSKNTRALYRIRAYRQAANVLWRLPRSVEEIYRVDGRAGLEAIPGIGAHLAYTLETLLRTGEFRTLNPYEGSMDPTHTFLSLPGVGARLAEQLQDDLGLTTLEELEEALADGRVERLGVGVTRRERLREEIQRRLHAARTAEPKVSA